MECIVIAGLVLVCILLQIIFRPKANTTQQQQIDNNQKQLETLQKLLGDVQQTIREEFRANRSENRLVAKDNRDETERMLNNLKTTVNQSFTSLETMQRERLQTLEKQQALLSDNTEKKLKEIKDTVDEKLQETLEERIGRSFKLVSDQLESVGKGLGEMRSIAKDVGGLKRVLSNVKTRGTIGEIQLGMLLEQMLAPSQYEANVHVKPGSSLVVEYAVKFPGEERADHPVYLPIDAKFPKEIYEHLLDAYDQGDPAIIEAAGKVLENGVRKMAKDIFTKYISPPYTTDFGIMFLPFEGIYAEVVRRTALLEELRQNYKVIVTGPTTLSAILNSLQMGFRALAIRQHSGEVWNILSAVKKEFDTFSGLLQKVRGNLQVADNQLEEMLGRRTRAIQRKLKDVDVLPFEKEHLLEKENNRTLKKEKEMTLENNKNKDEDKDSFVTSFDE
ncbi:MAG: DNA recombination protein RmuC [Massilibacteroides sp.]|nr:DNA recombination protein RmuC [Massilibacteroides sp.]